MLPHLFLHIKGRRGGRKDKTVRETQGRGERLQSFKCNSNIPSLSSDLLVFLSSPFTAHIICPSSHILLVFISLFMFYVVPSLLAVSLISSTVIKFDMIISLSVKKKKKKSGSCSDASLSHVRFHSCISFFLFCPILLLPLSSLSCDRYCSYRLSIGMVL